MTVESEIAPGTGPSPDGIDPSPERNLTDTFDRWSAAQRHRGLAVVVLAAVVAAWIVRFVQDDAFITFRFARNFERGHGLVLNQGERVEGYTNFLWTVLMAVPERMGWSAPMFSVLVGLAVMAVTIVVSFRLALLVFERESLALLSVLALVANMTFLGYGTSGLETMMQTMFVTAVALLLLERPGRSRVVPRRVAAGVVAGLACLTRLDSAVIVGTLFVLVVVHDWTSSDSSDSSARIKRAASAAASLGLPTAAVLLPWIIWKLDYYGDLLPNTFTAKSGSPLISIAYGIFYLLAFFASYFAFLFIKRFRGRRSDWFQNPIARDLSVVVAAWFVYICIVGADFMEYRFMVPVLPILAMLAAMLINRFRNQRSQVVFVAVLLCVSGCRAVMPSVGYPVLSFSDLRHWPTDSETSWVGLGKYLGSTFPGGEQAPDQPVISLLALGAISYYSDLPVVDMIGLADKEIARNGDQIPLYYPGHVRVSTVEQLVDKDVSLVVGLPLVLPREEDRTSYRLSELVALYAGTDLRRLPEDATVVEATVKQDRVLVMISLQQNPKVDALVESGEWRELDIDRTCDAADLNVVTRIVNERSCPGL